MAESIGRTPRHGVTLKSARVDGPPRDAVDLTGLGFLVLLFGGVALLLAFLVTWVLWKPLLAVVTAPAGAVRRDLAYRIRAIGYPVDVAKDVLKVKVDSITALKVHVREAEPGTKIRYEVDATGLGWTLVLIFAFAPYLGIASLITALMIHVRARRFARSRVAPLLTNPPLGTLPPRDTQTLLLEGLSEAHRLAQEALEYETEARQNAIGLLLIGGLVLWALVFFALSQFALLPFATAALLAFLASGATVVLGVWLVYVGRSPRIHELTQDADFYRQAWMGQVGPAQATRETRGVLELLLHAVTRSSYWRDVRRSRKFWHDPIAGLTMFILVYGAVIFSSLALVVDILSWEWRLLLGGLGATFAAGGIRFVHSWMREIQEQDERDRRSWEERREAIEAELWRILSG